MKTPSYQALLDRALPEYREQLTSVFKNCIVAGDCWEWMGARRDAGYGLIKIWGTRKNIGVHRFVCLALGGQINDDNHVCHSCDNPPCCNPDHLFVGTPKENHQDSVNKGRDSTPPRLSWANRRHPSAKLTRHDIPLIREALRNGLPIKAIAKRFGVSFQTISKIKTGALWSHA